MTLRDFAAGSEETALIPYFQIPSLPIFDGVAIHPFGVLGATGILSGAMLTRRRGQQLGLDDDLVKNMIFWSVATGLLMAHFLDVLVYQKYFAFQPNLANTRFDNYAGRIYSYFVAPSNGLYRFYIRSVDAAQLYMNTNAVNSTDPAGAVLLGQLNAFTSAYTLLDRKSVV